MSKVYINGGCLIELDNDGSRTIYGDLSTLRYPNSLDIKITEKCYTGCPFCHESSSPGGKEANLEKLIEILKPIPGNIELAIGGGNPLLYSRIYELLEYLVGRGFTVNMTIRDTELKLRTGLIEDLGKYITAWGISVTPGFDSSQYLDILGNNYVAHYIIGFNRASDIKEYFPRILLLGYKNYGRGKIYKPENNDWEKFIKQGLYQQNFPWIISFDNLALEQLNIRACVLEKEWEKYYQGPDLTQSFYIDAVQGFYSPNSYSDTRISWDNLNILDYYDRANR